MKPEGKDSLQPTKPIQHLNWYTEQQRDDVLRHVVGLKTQSRRPTQNYRGQENNETTAWLPECSRLHLGEKNELRRKQRPETRLPCPNSFVQESIRNCMHDNNGYIRAGKIILKWQREILLDTHGDRH
ncbi:hypothetical protein HOLleu_29272 [Holothuria leucospilota]|uniref:Uncharacterized protein n=1 Tax=Holothuria leucospilota TaxID=206669 RepID=A0A9Q1GZE1_HOLLE|nr:hypothetical protein HOLleu_29272 [Holothuria leucospilota]